MAGVLRHSGLLAVLAVGEFLMMLIIEFFLFRRMSGGLPSLDLRPTGFTAQEGAGWVKALEPTGAQTVLVWNYLTFDLVFPALLGLALASMIFTLGQRLRGFSAMSETVQALFSLAVVAPFVVTDYAQNWVITGILTDPAAAGPSTYAFASSLGVAKFAFLALVVIIIAFFGLAALRQRDR